MKHFLSLLICIVIFSCRTEEKKLAEFQIPNSEIKKDINIAIDNWHKAAAEANFDNYFNLMTDSGVFIGTDATENWQNDEFKSFSKPYFDKGKAWSFTPIQRNIYAYDDNKLAWFDELLDTQMKICRGSGIVKLVDNQWKIEHYVLSIAVPNENVSEVVKLKSDFDSIYVQKLKMK